MNLLAIVTLTALTLAGTHQERQLPEHDELAKTGDVALDDWPMCDFFVVHTSRGFALVMWQSGLWIFGEGDDVYGLADRVGRQTILLAGPILSGQMTVDIEATGVDLADAQAAFYKRCKIP